MNKRIEILTLWVTWIVRLLTGAVFIYSGFVKAVDPWGTLYKFIEYFDAWHLNLPVNLLLVAVFALCIYEFVIGVFLVSGAFRRSTPLFALLFMCVMLPLTLWIAMANPVEDCGCFGDALILTNWQTFWKNIILTLLLVWLLRFNTRLQCLIRPSIQWIALITSSAYIVCLAMIGYYYQPLIDFRPYPDGAKLIDDGVTEDDESEYLFIYRKDGVDHSFTIEDTLPDEADGWEFIERRRTDPSKVIISKHHNSASTFRIWSEDGNEDVTDEVIDNEGDYLLLLMPDLDNVSISTTWKINALYRWTENNDISMMAVVAATPQGIERWYDLALPEYPIYTAEDTEIKMLARGNPAVAFIRDGKVEWKSTLRALPNDDFASDKVNISPDELKRDDKTALRNITWLYIAVMAAIICLSYMTHIPKYFQLYRRRSSSDESTH
ncbi:MAG: DoxX family protein [Muribaculaceae bacterium]|nr:DoxX family protein [Muribaculaceae bacterium]